MNREEWLWEKLVEEAGEELVERAAAVSVAQAEKELAEAGFDVAAERARAEAFLASLESLGSAAAVEEVVAQDAPPMRAAKSKGVDVTELRKRAAAACAASRFDECLSLLDEAATQDPAGDATPEVRQQRKEATSPRRLK